MDSSEDMCGCQHADETLGNSLWLYFHCAGITSKLWISNLIIAKS